MKIIVLGNKGLVGGEIYDYFRRIPKYECIGSDIDKLDLNNLNDVVDFFKSNKADVLINAFGKNDHVTKNDEISTVNNINEHEIRDYFEINSLILFRVCREFLKNNQNPKIFNFSSMYGHHVPNPNYYDGRHKSIGYCISKSAAVMITKYLAVHYPLSEIIDIVLGGVENNQPKSFKEEFLKSIPKKRMLDKKEVPNIIEGLINSKYITGTSIFIDGGKNLI